MRFFDQHLHSWNSFDCESPPEQNVQAAIDAGLSGLTFTEHFDTHPTEWEGCIFDDEKIERELAELRDRFGDQIFIGKGIEVCYQPARMAYILEFLRTHRFDVILLSVHWASGKPIHRSEHFDGFGCEDYLKFYLEGVRDCTAHLAQMKRDGNQPFHIFGHLDLARRYARQMFKFDGPLNEPKLVDEILRNCLEAGIIPEINTSTLRQGLSGPMPDSDTIDRYADLGGTMMSFGSDAHRPEDIGAGGQDVLALMREAGLTELAFFENGLLRAESLTG